MLVGKNIARFHLYEEPKIIRLLEMESSMVGAWDCGLVQGKWKVACM